VCGLPPLGTHLIIAHINAEAVQEYVETRDWDSLFWGFNHPERIHITGVSAQGREPLDPREPFAEDPRDYIDWDAEREWRQELERLRQEERETGADRCPPRE
jgi:hypothetical protein